MEVGATFTPRKNNSNRFCCVYGCTSLARRNPEIKFATFPKITDAVRRKKWINVLKMGKKVTDSMSVCSLHFKRDDYINLLLQIAIADSLFLFNNIC
ncbi:unnamed protein product [Macrosiphum euphorbiae]|uniref:THAP-type domain-containing protein n=1 Tax=Macrosiphum euphorbiae TaxID=13131 RepID=A0AAV0VQT5_9HEMI|nr:unnamed protein product [Macrosiphum euphorbiae]CAI6354554.1 unnamed protein product [Macrosiphum euphorbiae]